MSEIDQGGFVYPFGEVNHSGPDKYPVYEGITLRQHYAGLAMQAIISKLPIVDQQGEFGTRVDDKVQYNLDIAVSAFCIADAMIEAGKQ